MTSPEDLILDKSPSYFRHPEAPYLIQKHSPSSKFLLVVCDPVRRIGSDFIHTQIQDEKFQRIKEPKREIIAKRLLEAKYEYLNLTNIYGLTTLETTLDEFLKLESGGYNTSCPLISTSVYVKHIKTWLSLFPKEQLLVVNGGDLIDNPYSVFKDVETFLSLKSFVKNDTFIKGERVFPCWKTPNSEKGKYEEQYNIIDGSYYQCELFQGSRETKGRKHPEMSHEIADLIQWLKDYFKPYNKELFKVIGKRFKWKMDKI